MSQSLTKREPAVVIAAVVGVIEAVLLLVVVFGVDLTTEQMAAVIGVAVAIGALVTGTVTRTQVTPYDPAPPPPPTDPGLYPRSDA